MHSNSQLISEYNNRLWRYSDLSNGIAVKLAYCYVSYNYRTHSSSFGRVYGCLGDGVGPIPKRYRYSNMHL